MWPATTWDDSDWDGGTRARGWTVMGRIRGKQQDLRHEKYIARRRLDDDAGLIHMMTPALIEQQYRDRLAAAWRGSFTVLAFLFAMPDEATIEMLNRRGEYFDVRSGDVWDLFFPGYYRSADHELERQVFDTKPVGDQYAADWYFNVFDFDLLRQHVEDSTEGRWRYSGGSDLVLINAYVPERGEPTIDWASTQSGTIQPPETLARVIERITGDLKDENESADYGVGSVTKAALAQGESPSEMATRDFMVQALAGIATALGLKWMGL